MKISREIKTAILVLASVGLVVWGISFLSGNNIFKTSRTYLVEYPNVEGLSTASTVTVSGLVVGKVSSIQLQPNKSLLVELTIDNPVEITKSTRAVIYAPSFLGGKQISLDINYDNPEVAESGYKLNGGNLNGLIDGLGEKVDPLAQKLDSVLYNVNLLVQGINNTLDPETQRNLREAVVELNATMKNVNGITGKFDRIVSTNEGKINNIVSDFNKTSSNLSKFSNDLDKIQLEKLQDVLNKFDKSASSLQAILSDVENGKGNIGKLVKEEDLYNNLQKASKELNQLLEDVKLNPKRYINISVFGKTAQPYSEPSGK